MSNEEVIRFFKKEQSLCLRENTWYKMLGVAIKALSQQTEDAISRETAIGKIEKWLSFDDYNEAERHIMKAIISELRDMPSVTPKQSGWIPVSKGLPEDRDWYLGIFKEPDTGWVNPIPFICDYVGRETKATTKEHWILQGFTDRDVRDRAYYFNLECVAWMPLPKPYEPQESEDKK